MDKISLEEYKNKYSKSYSPILRKSKSALTILLFALGLVIVVCLYFVILKGFEVNNILGYVSIALSVILFIFFYIVPIVKINKTNKFELNVNKNNLKQVKAYNKKVRLELSNNIISLYDETNDTSWYSDKNVELLKLSITNKSSDDNKLVLNEIYKTDIKKAANNLIKSHANKVGLITAISQSEKLDTIFVAYDQISLIKDLIYLYGFRPSDQKLLKIYKNVLINSLIAYGSDSLTSSLSKSIAKNLGEKVFTSIPLLGELVGSVIGSVANGVINGAMSVVIGTQTQKYLIKEYNLSLLIDNIEEINSNETELIKEVKENIEESTKEIKHEKQHKK